MIRNYKEIEICDGTNEIKFSCLVLYYFIKYPFLLNRILIRKQIYIMSCEKRQMFFQVGKDKHKQTYTIT